MSDDRKPRGAERLKEPAPDDRSSGRDYGDSAGYGGGGAAVDYDELLGDDDARRLDRKNPLDEVAPTNRQGGSK
jgi:hypothetical protein